MLFLMEDCTQNNIIDMPHLRGYTFLTLPQFNDVFSWADDSRGSDSDWCCLLVYDISVYSTERLWDEFCKCLPAK